MDLPRFSSPRVIRWLVVGTIFSGLGLGLLKLFVGILAWPYWLGTLCSGEITTLFRFLVVDRWVFGHPRPTGKRLWQYHVANGLGFAVWWSVANLLERVGVHYLLASIFAMCASVGFNLLTNFLWVWRKSAPHPAHSSMNAAPITTVGASAPRNRPSGATPPGK